MNTIINSLLLAPASIPPDNMPAEMTSNSLFIAGSVMALLIFIYLLIALLRPEKF